MKIDITNYVTNEFKMQIASKIIVNFVIVPKKYNYVAVTAIKYENQNYYNFTELGNGNDISNNAFF